MKLFGRKKLQKFTPGLFFRRDDKLEMTPEGFAEAERILTGKSGLAYNEQAFIMWYYGEILEEFLQYPAEVKELCRATRLPDGKEVAEGLLKKVRAREAELTARWKSGGKNEKGAR